MALLWVLLWSAVQHLVLVSALDPCGFHEGSSSHSVSSLLESLKCYNDYRTHVHCKWKKHTNATLQLWFKTQESSKLCEPSEAAAEPGIVHCRYETPLFAIGIKHTVFFMSGNTTSLCSSAPRTSMDLLQHLRALPPVNLSTHETVDGGQKLQWSSSYLPSSSLNKNLTYELSYRMQAQDNWTAEIVTNTSLKLERRSLLPGRTYEARVRTRASMGQWSDWSPVLTWKTKVDLEQVPTLHCLLVGEKEVSCSWEVSRELAYIITYQLACRYSHGAPFERCCSSPKLNSDPSGTAVWYSCSLTIPDHEYLQVDLLPAHNTKTFKPHQHIRPDPPRQVKVSEKDENWIVNWNQSVSELPLWHQICYYRTDDQGSAVMLNISEESSDTTILGSSLTPLQQYQVKVRSLVTPGDGSLYEGIPSEWTNPVKWTSNKASWSFTTLAYIVISVIVATAFLILYCSIPACQRKITLWVDSVPSPGKSKILSEIKSAACQTHMQSEKTTICKAWNIDSMSTCSSQASLWSSKDTEKKCANQDPQYCTCDKLCTPADKVIDCDTSSMSFSGPYILCQVSEPVATSSNVLQEEKDKESIPDVSASPSHVPCPLYSAEYVCLPSHSVSRSTQDLTFHGKDTTSPTWFDGTEQDKTCSDTTMWSIDSASQSSLCEPTTRVNPRDYVTGPFIPWSPVGTMQNSGYCHLPPAFMTATK